MNKNKEKERQDPVVAALLVTNKAKTVYKSNLALKTIFVVLVSITSLLLFLLGTIGLVKEAGAFTVSIQNPDSTKALSLSLSKDMSKPTVNLDFATDSVITNITETDIPINVDSIDGNHCGSNYLAYTFYLQNNSEGEVDVETNMEITQVVKNADDAVRIKIYENGVPIVYAKEAADGNEEPGTIKFISEQYVYESTFSMQKDEIKKYTVVVWLEGNDPECLDNIKGGSVKLAMEFEAV